MADETRTRTTDQATAERDERLRRGEGTPDREAGPDQLSDIEGSGWWATAKRAFKEFREDNMMDWGAALTYYAVLSLFPALILLVGLLGLFGQHPQTTNALLNIVGQFAPDSTVESVRGAISGAVQSGGGIAVGLGLLGALWTASGYLGAFFRASNSIYEVDEGRSFFKLRPLQMALTVFLLVVITFAAIVFVATGSVADAIGSQIGLGDTAVTVWSIAKWPVLALVVAALFAVLYYAAPNVKQPKLRWLTPGGAIGLTVWILASAAFGFYVANFGSYGETYGALAGVVIFLIWLWISNLALLFGAEFDAELQRQRKIEGGMRPKDKEPFLPHREPPEE